MNKLSADELKQAREWLAECSGHVLYEDAVDNIATFSDAEIERMVAALFDGGLDAFKLSCIPLVIKK